MAKKIASLIVDIEASTASLNKGFADARQSVDKFGSQVKTAMRAIGASFAVREIGQFVQRQIDVADNFRKLSQKTGVATETLSSYAHGARLAGVETQQLAVGFGKLSRGMLDALGGSKEQKQAFAALGVEFKTAGGGLRSLDDVLGDVAQKFSQMADGATKSALAQRLFGKSGAEMIPFLNLGRAGMEATRKEAEKLGVVISGEFAAQAEVFNDSLTRMKARLEGVAIAAAGPVVRAVNDLFDALEGRSQAFASKREFLDSLLVRIPSAVIPGFGALMERITPELAIKRTPAESAAAEMDKMFRAGRAALQQAKVDAGLLNRELRDKAAEEFKKQLQGAAAALRDTSAALTLATQLGPRGVFGMGRKDLPDPGFALKDALGLPREFPTATLEESGFKTQLRDFAAEARAVRESLKTIGDQGIASAQQLHELFAAGAIDADTFNAAMKRVRDSIGSVDDTTRKLVPLWQQMKEQLQGISQAGLAGIGDALLGLQSWKNLARQVLADLGRMLWYLLVVQPLIGKLFGGGSSGGGGGGGGFFSKLFGALFGGLGSIGQVSGTPPLVPTRQFGGPVMAGRLYETHGLGKREFFRPDVSGAIVPSGRGGQGVTINNNVDARGADIGTIARTAAIMDRHALEQFALLLNDRAQRTA